MNSQKGIPLLTEEGWLRHQKNAAKPPLKAQTGWSVAHNVSRINIYQNDHPVCAASVASHLFLNGAATPPVSGGECAWPIHSRVLENLRSEEHTSELQSQSNLVCRLLLEKKKTISTI